MFVMDSALSGREKMRLSVELSGLRKQARGAQGLVAMQTARNIRIVLSKIGRTEEKPPMFPVDDVLKEEAFGKALTDDRLFVEQKLPQRSGITFSLSREGYRKAMNVAGAGKNIKLSGKQAETLKLVNAYGDEGVERHKLPNDLLESLMTLHVRSVNGNEGDQAIQAADLKGDVAESVRLRESLRLLTLSGGKYRVTSLGKALVAATRPIADALIERYKSSNQAAEFDKSTAQTGPLADHAEWAEVLADKMAASEYMNRKIKIIYSDNRVALMAVGGLEFAVSAKRAKQAVDGEATISTLSDQGIISLFYGEKLNKKDHGSIFLQSDRRRLNAEYKKYDKEPMAPEYSYKGYTIRRVGDKDDSFVINRADGTTIPRWDDNGESGGHYYSLREAKSAINTGRHEPPAELQARQVKVKEPVVTSDLNLKGLVKTWYQSLELLRSGGLSAAERLDMAKQHWDNADDLREKLERMSVQKLWPLLSKVWLQGGDISNKYAIVDALLREFRARLAPDGATYNQMRTREGMLEALEAEVARAVI